MSRRHRTQPTVSLFPFLAVLICTMGSLIVLLVVVAQQARNTVAAPAVSAVPVATITPQPPPMRVSPPSPPPQVVDGAVSAQWLAAFRALVESPLTMLL